MQEYTAEDAVDAAQFLGLLESSAGFVSIAANQHIVRWEKGGCLKMREYCFNGERYYLKSEVDSRNIELDNWKGKDNVKIIHDEKEDSWFVHEHRKDKETGEIGKNVHIIPNRDVIFIRNLVKERSTNGRKTKYREIALDIITSKNLPISIEEFNGGRNRSKYYFNFYYYPIKILEYLGEIIYGGRGTILKIRNEKI
jgi:hypothetical protein